MVAVMVLIELFVMKGMYTDTKTNIIIIAVMVALLVLSILSIRKQFLINDKQFLRSMIPHHSAALLMCKQAHLQDPEIKKLCQNIISSQQSEIDWMESKL